MPKLGCSTTILVWSCIILLVLFIIGLAIGPIGASILGTEAPSFLRLTSPHVELPSEEVSNIAGFPITNTLISSWFTIIILVGIFYACTRKMKLIPGRLQNLAEMVVEGLLNFVEEAAGKERGRILFPAVATIFIYVITNAYLSLLPFFGTVGITGHEGHLIPLFRGANTDINVPLSIAVMSFVFIEYWGMRSIGAFRYIGEFITVGQIGQGFKQFFKGKIRPAITDIGLGFINLFVGMLEIFSHFIRIISFTFRLFGNMTAGEILLLCVCFLVPLIATIPFYGLELLIGFIQALIFAGLTLAFGMVAITPAHEEPEQT